MYAIGGEKIKREVALHFRGSNITATIVRPIGKQWVEHKYRPTPASVNRIKRLISYPYCGPVICHTGHHIHWMEYSAEI